MPAPLLAQLNYWQLVLNGGLTNLCIFLLSVVAVATIIERFFGLRGDQIVSAPLIKEVKRRWDTGTRIDLEKFCSDHGGTFCGLVNFLSRHRDRDYATLSSAVSDMASVQVRRHIQRVYPLALVATLTPLAGLFGTVLGMVETFHTVAEVGNAGNIGLLASGIYKALSTTAAGLVVAIPALAFYHYFRMRICTASLLLEEGVNELLNDSILPREAPHAHS